MILNYEKIELLFNELKKDLSVKSVEKIETTLKFYQIVESSNIIPKINLVNMETRKILENKDVTRQEINDRYKEVKKVQELFRNENFDVKINMQNYELTANGIIKFDFDDEKNFNE